MIAATLSENSTQVLVQVLILLSVIIPAVLLHRRAMQSIAANDEKVDAVAESVGAKNGHGTVQDQGIEILERLDRMESRQHATQTSLDSIVDAAGLMTDRLKHHDREHQRHRHRLDDHHTRITTLEGS